MGILRKQKSLFFLIFTFVFGTSAILAQSITVNVDATDATRGLTHVRETVTVANAGSKFDLFYPKWIPGEHSPDGPINNMVNLHVRANGKEIAWRRDDVEMFAFHCEAPADVIQLEITFDDAADYGTTFTPQLARIKWNRLILYPRGVRSDDIQVTASLKMPDGWKYATALPLDKENGPAASFKSVSLTTFIDSPAIIGRYFKRYVLTDGPPVHEIDVVADNAAALEAKPEMVAGWKELVRQAQALYGAHHYNSYKFLLTLSDAGGDEGLEHHESSEDGVGEGALSDKFAMIDLADLLGHEYTHSWNGKYRRPARLATPDFEQPMHGDLLWVYEGLTEYLGKVLPSRSKLWSPDDFREAIADYTANMDYTHGRHWRPLVDTARAVQFTYSGDRHWRNSRRAADYYYEGMLIWLDADILIRQKSGGKLSLDDFCKKFHGGESSGPALKPYELDDVVATLNSVLPYDWKGFFEERVYRVADHAPMGGITNGGWKLVYTDKPNSQMEMNSHLHDFDDFSYSLGLLVNGKGEVRDIVQGSLADKAGLAPGMIIQRINGGEFSVVQLNNAVSAARKTSDKITLSVEGGGEMRVVELDYHGGNLYPHLVRDDSKPDLLSDVIKSR
jgi:predicted metalloprotease with PDZ domain